MTIEIHQPELEALIQQRMASGQFRDVEDVLRQALESALPPPATSESPQRTPSQRLTLREVFEAARGLGDDLDITRNPSTARPIEL